MSVKDMFYTSKHKFSNAEERVFAREQLVYNVTEDILVALEDKNISKKELARRLGKSRSFVTQCLSGARNMTLGTFSDICYAIDAEPSVKVKFKRDIESVRGNKILEIVSSTNKVVWDECHYKDASQDMKKTSQRTISVAETNKDTLHYQAA